MKTLNGCAEILGAIDAKLQDYKYHKTIPAFIYGVKCDLTEPEVRALQTIVATMDDKEFYAFNGNVTIWSGPDFDHVMILRKDGLFENEFEPGFMDVNAELAFEIL